jgi:hypothetical protein
MGDLLKTVVSAPTNTVLLLAGIAFLAVAVFGRITDKLDAGPKGRIAAAALGAVFLAISLYLSATDRPAVPAPGSTAEISPQKAPPAPEATAKPSVSAPAPAAPAPAVPAAVPAPQAEPASADGATTPSYPVTLASGQVVKGETRTYTILDTKLDRHEMDQLALAFRLRMQNDADYPVNFWNASFRLLVDGVPTAPIGELNELVESHAAKEGTVRFALPKDAKSVSLQIDKFGAEAPGIAVALPAAR